MMLELMKIIKGGNNLKGGDGLKEILIYYKKIKGYYLEVLKN